MAVTSPGASSMEAAAMLVWACSADPAVDHDVVIGAQSCLIGVDRLEFRPGAEGGILSGRP